MLHLTEFVIGMSIRSAYALGLHREETQVIFTDAEQTLRENLMRSLFVMDRVLSASLGRPMAVLEDDCSGDALKPSDSSRDSESSNTGVPGLEASVRSCHDIGVILREVYHRRKTSTKLAQKLADQCKTWPASLSPALHWRQASSGNPRQAIAILHVNLLYCHSVILLTRPFFLYLINAEASRMRRQTDSRSRRSAGKMEKFSDACIIAALHTVALTQTAFDGKYLPRRSVFVTYFLFAAALILLSNEFTSLSFYPASSYCIDNAIKTLSYCGECDPQAARGLDILIAFRDVVTNKNNQQSPQIPEIPFSVSVPTTEAQTTSFTSFQPSASGTVASSVDFPIANLIETPSGSQFDASAVAYSRQPPPRPQPLPPPNPIHHSGSFFGLLDLTNNVLPTISEGDSGTDEYIDFNALWHWPGFEVTNSTAVETELPRLDYAGVQGVSESSVPLYGTVEIGGI